MALLTTVPKDPLSTTPITTATSNFGSTLALAPTAPVSPAMTPQETTGLAERYGMTPPTPPTPAPITGMPDIITDPLTGQSFQKDGAGKYTIKVATPPVNPTPQTKINDVNNAGVSSYSGGVNSNGQQLPGFNAPKLPTLEEIRTALTPGKGIPEAPKLVELYNSLTSQKGIGDLESTVTNLDSQISEEQARLRSFTRNEEGKAIASDIISGKLSTEAAASRDTLEFLTRQRDSVVKNLTNKYKTVETIMNLTKDDYNTALGSYEKQFANNISLYNTFNTATNQAQTAADRARDDARANLQIITNNISSKGLDLSTVPEDTKALVNRLELQAGFPSGMTQFLQTNVKGDIISTTSRTNNGIQYYDILTRQPDGSFKNVTVERGAGTSGTGADTAGDFAKAKQFITDNPNASYIDLQVALRSNTKLTDGDISTVLESAGVANLPPTAIPTAAKTLVATLFSSGFFSSRGSELETAKKKAKDVIEASGGAININGKNVTLGGEQLKAFYEAIDAISDGNEIKTLQDTLASLK